MEFSNNVIYTHTLKWRQQQYQNPEKVAGSIANILMGGGQKAA